MTKTVLALILAGALASFTFIPADGNFQVDAAASQLKWTGYHLAKSYEHSGFVKIKSGKFSVANHKITSGEFVIDMGTISNTDVKEAKDNAKLVDHLKSDDFFNTKKFPEAKLVIKGSEVAGNGLKVTADLTIRGITKQVVFDATLNEDESQKVIASAQITVKRTEFKVMYGWKAENAVLSGDFKMDVKLVGIKG